MRFIVIKQNTDLQRLGTTLFRGATTGGATLERIAALNPHVDLKKIRPGTVLLLPESPDLAAEETNSLAGDAFDNFAAEVTRGVGTMAKRVGAAAEIIAEDRTSVAAALRPAAVKRLVESDPVLKKELAAADEQAKADIAEAQDAAKKVDELQKLVAVELKALSSMLR